MPDCAPLCAYPVDFGLTVIVLNPGQPMSCSARLEGNVATRSIVDITTQLRRGGELAPVRPAFYLGRELRFRLCGADAIFDVTW